MARLSAISERIDKLATVLPRPIDPRLAHYLQRRSYDKALEFLEQLYRRLREAPNLWPLGRANVIGRRPVLRFLPERGRRFPLVVIL